MSYDYYEAAIELNWSYFETDMPRKNWFKKIVFKGVLHPRLVFGLFLHFSQKIQHIGNK